MFKKILATFATLLLAAGLSVVAVAAPASAHDAALSGVATCQADGTYSVTWTGTLSNYGSHQEIDIKVIKSEPAGSLINGVNGQVWLYEWVSHSANHSLPPFPANGVFTYTQTNIPGTAKSAVSSYQFDWKDGPSGDPEKKVTLAGDCSKATTPDSAADIKINPATCESAATLELLTPTFATWGNVTGSYTVVATATDGHRFPTGNSPGVTVSSDGKTKTFTGTLDKKLKPKDCESRDATATVSTTPATCSAAEKDVVVNATNATYVVTYPTATTYKVTATAAAGHRFADGETTLVINGTFAPQQTQGCAPPECLPKSAVTYTYFPATNNGVVTVVNPNPAKYTNDLCSGFWVTATSWHYTTSGVWPQILYQNNPLAKITSVGTYPFGAEVLCGQGDIYASFTASPYVGPELFGPNNPFTEKFLHDMGFAGPSPTYMQTATGCNDAPVAIPTADKITECGTYGSVNVPADTAKIDYTLTGNGQTGINTVTAVAIAPYVLKNYPVGGWSFDLKSYYDCELALTLTYVPDCAVDETNNWKVYNPSDETILVTYAGGTHSATPGYSDLVTAASDDEFEITWGASGSGIAPGSTSEIPGADLPADDPKCIKISEPVSPTLVFVDECGEYGSVTPVEKTGVTYNVKFDQTTGQYKVIATPAFGYYFEGASQEVVYEGTVNPYYECVEEPDVSIAYGECVYNEDGSADQRHVSITFDNSGSNKPVYFALPWFPEYNKLVAAGEVFEFDVADIWPAGGAYDVTAAGKSFLLEIPACDLPTLPDPIVWEVPTPSYDCSTVVTTISTLTYTQGWKFDTELVEWVQQEPVVTGPVITTRPMTEEEITQEKCLVVITDPEASTCSTETDATDFTSWIRVHLNVNVEYRIDGVLATTEYVEVTPGVHTVTADALNGYTLTGGSPDVWTDTHHEWTYTAVDSTLSCDPPTLATVTPEFSSTPLTCTAAGSYTLGELTPGTVQWTVNGVPTAVGTYPVTTAKTLTFLAAPVLEEDGLDEDWVQPGAITFSPGAAPCDLVTLALTGATTPFALIWVALLLVLTGFGIVLIRRRLATDK